MYHLNPYRYARFAVWLAAIALLFAAMSPTLNAWRSKGQPQLYAELCTKFGFVKISLAGDEKPSKNESHAAPECSMCLPAGTWLGFAISHSLSVPSIDGTQAPHLAIPHAAPALVAHTLAWTHAPPASS